MEKEEERQLQELQRLQEEQTGRKRTEKLEWMYATPATGNGANSNDLEDYLLGKKRVDKLLVGDENQAVRSSCTVRIKVTDFSQLGASHKNFIAVQHANTLRDTAAKVREDPLFMIKQQEQVALQTLRENPLRLKEMQQRNGLLPKSAKKEKEKKKRRRRSRSPPRREQRRRRSYSRSRSLSSSRHRSQERMSRQIKSSRRSVSRSRRDSRSPKGRLLHESCDYDRHRRRDLSFLRESRYPPPIHSRTNRSEDELTRSLAPTRRSLESSSHRSEESGSPPRRETGYPDCGATEGGESNRADRLAAMVANASEANEERRRRLATRLAEEKAELESEDQLRARSGGSSSFINDQQRRVFGGMDGGLGEYMRRGKTGLVLERD
jgi:hypothetical protein